ncbi:50S ribosome-binding GTPase [Candidatus Woesearchaeota archaeon]|nr:50S ribosome-binding GTPase [Candidatus Woesearchaeota archaeon]
MVNSFFEKLLKLLSFNPFAKRDQVKLGLYGPPNGGKCVTSDTKIVQFNGEIKSIQEIFEEVRDKLGNFNSCANFQETFIDCSELDLVVPSLDTENLKIVPKKISFVYAQKYTGDIYKITTSSGREIKVTPNHPLITISNGGINKILSSELKVGDCISVAQKAALASTITLPVVQEAHYQYENGMLISPAKWHHPKGITVPSIVDDRLVRFVGYAITESYHTQNRIIFTNQDDNLINDFEKLSLELFKLQPIKRFRKGSVALDVSSKTLTDYLEEILHLKPGTAESKEIPAQLMGLPDNLTAELLKTLYDCEGYVSKNVKSAGGKEIEYSSKSRKLVEQVQLLLNRFGIVGKFWEKKVKGQSYYRLSIRGSDNHKLFRNNIGFTIGYKKERLEQLCQNNHPVPLKRNAFTLPIVGLLEKIRKQQGLTQAEFFLDGKHGARMLHNNRISYHRLKNMAEVNSHPLISKIANSDCRWDNIISIEKMPYDSYVYDLTIEDTHTFMISNGLIAHNSTLANRICEDWLGESMSAVSHIPHETREIIMKEQVTIKNKRGKQLTFSLVDTPGIATKVDFEDFMRKGLNKDESKKRAKEATKGVIDSIKWLDKMDSVIVVLDATQDPYSQVNVTILGNLQARDIPVLIAANKVDLKKASIDAVQSAFPQYKVVGVSAKYGKNVEEFYEELFKLAK